LPENDLNALKKRADEQNTTVSNLVRNSLNLSNKG
jgi:hypothetical protein